MVAAAIDIRTRIAEALGDHVLLDRVQSAFASPHTNEPAPIRVTEAYGQSVDDDDAQWRRLTGTSERDLSPMTQARMQKLALYLWESNLLANRLIELPVAYLLAEGVQLQVADEEAQGWIDAFWRDPINAFERKLKKKVRELLLYGEQCWPAFTNPHNGHVRLGYLDPALIETVVTDPDNIEVPIGLITTRDRKGRARRYRLIHNGAEADLFTRRTQKIRESFTDGECFYYRINDLSNGTRGRSALLAQIDWLDAYDQFLFGEIDRAQFLRAFMWDVTLSGATEEQVKARARKISAPKPNSVRVHNDAEAWEAVSPSLQSEDSAEGARLFRNHVLGGSTMPEHWYGGAADVNRATGESMGEPTFKILSGQQRDIGAILEDLAVFQVNRRVDPSGKSVIIDPYNPDPDLLPVCVWPELTARDTSKYAAALQQVTTGAVVAIEAGLLSKETALEQIAAISGRLGVEFDVEQELTRAREQARTQSLQDVYSDDPDTEETGDENA